MHEQTYDYIVVGAGAAGCAVAGRLAEGGAHRIALLEAGGPDRNICFHIPGLMFMVSTAAKYNWNFMTEPIPELNDRQLKLLHGKVLGGSSSINGMQYTRGYAQEYDAWRDGGCEGWGFSDVLPYFKRAETNARGAGPWHGGSGPLKTRPAKPNLPICDAFIAAAADAGYPIFTDANAGIDEGFGFSDVNIGNGRRMSSATAYLRDKKSITMFLRSQALRVLIEGGKATGVEYLRDGVRHVLRCEREIVLSAGGIKSPHLLMLSGIGPADELRASGIPVVVDARGVGENLQNHPVYRVQYTCAESVTSFKYLKPGNAIRAGLQYLLGRGGPLGESYAAAGGFFRTDASCAVPNVQVSMLTSLLYPTASANPRFWELLPKQEGISFTVAIQPFSRGKVSLRSDDPLDAPLVAPDYFSDPRDLPVLMKAVNRTREIMRGRAIRGLIKKELQPGEGVTDDAALVAEIRKGAAHSYHPSGTCAMGDAPQAVVDHQLRVRGVDGLRVADASIMPTIPNAGLHGPTIMIGEKAASMIAACA